MRVQVKANNSLAIDHFGCILACLSHKLDRGLLVNDRLSTTDLSGRAFTRQACESRLIRFRYMSRRRMPSSGCSVSYALWPFPRGAKAAVIPGIVRWTPEVRAGSRPSQESG